MSNRITIIGAGLTGLAAAVYLSRAGVPVTLLEASSKVGGRMNSRRVNGCIVDEGFQVSLTSYPLLRELCVPWEGLGARRFASGAQIYRGEGSPFVTLHNPVRHPLPFISSLPALFRGTNVESPKDGDTVSSTAFSGKPLLSARDGIALLRVAANIFGFSSSSREELLSESTDDFLRRVALSSPLREQFFLPFLRGVLLDTELTSPALLSLQLLRYFTLGDAILFRDGAGSVPQFLSSLLPEDTVRLKTRCVAIQKHPDGFCITAEGEGGQSHFTSPIVITAVRETEIAGLVSGFAPELALQKTPSHNFLSRTLLFKAPIAPYPLPILTLNGSPYGNINHLAVLSNVHPAYAPPGEHLIAVCPKGSSIAPVEDIQKEISVWFPACNVPSWQCIDETTVNFALPSAPALGDGFSRKGDLFVAGDHLSYGSQNGALLAGKRVAQQILSEQRGETLA